MKRAILFASGICVCCPHCGDYQPNPIDGSDIWLPDEITKIAASPNAMRQCVGCDEEFLVQAEGKVMVQS